MSSDVYVFVFLGAILSKLQIPGLFIQLFLHYSNIGHVKIALHVFCAC